uniref:Thioredoxin domain-containing protein n=1 Tax=viral metagenome TaxID=1070528 RepID=A0A6C0LRL6_9ZZZZ
MFAKNHSLLNHIQTIEKLINEFKSKLNDQDVSGAKKLLREIRLDHACAIYDAFCYKKLLHKNEKNNTKISDDEWLELSNNECLLSMIHRDMREVEKQYFSVTDEQLFKHDSFTKAIETSQKDNQQIEEINIDIPSSSINPKFEESVSLFTCKTKNFANATLTECANDSEMARIASETYTKLMNNNQNGGGLIDFLKSIEKEESPVIVNFWSSNCSYSNKFKPNWDNFIVLAKQKFGNKIKILDLNAKNYPDLSHTLTKIEISGYPTVVLFNNGKYIHYKGNRSPHDLLKFISVNI